MYRKAMLLGLLGYAIGALIGLAIVLLQGETVDVSGTLPRILLGGIPGALAMGSSVAYGIEKWSILRATATHFLITMCALCFGGYVLQWFGPERSMLWIMIAVSLAAYIAIWLAFYFSYKKTIRRMNEDLQKMKSASGGKPFKQE